MSYGENVKYRHLFKKYYLELLYFYWQLSDDSVVVRSLEEAFGMSMREYSKSISEKEMDLEIMHEASSIIRTTLGLELRSIIDKSNGFNVKFQLFVIGG